MRSTYHAASSNHERAAPVGTHMGINCRWLRPHEANLLLVPPAVARSQSRHLVSHVLESNHAELVEKLRQLGDTAGKIAYSTQETR